MSEKEQKTIDQPSQESAEIRPEVPTKSLEQEKRPREPSQRETANMIAARLGETEESVCQQFVSIVKALGRTQAHALFEQTLQIEQNGGMMLPDHSRRRTPGGVFSIWPIPRGCQKKGRPSKDQASKNQRQRSQRLSKPHRQRQPYHLPLSPGKTGSLCWKSCKQRKKQRAPKSCSWGNWRNMSIKGPTRQVSCNRRDARACPKDCPPDRRATPTIWCLLAPNDGRLWQEPSVIWRMN